MKKGKYQAQRKPKRINWIGVCFWIVLLAIIIAGIILLTKSCGKENSPADTPETTLADIATEPSSEPETEPVTEPTEEETQPTEEETEPTTEPTEEETEPTEPETEPSTEPEEDTPVVAPEYDDALGQKIVTVAKSTLGKPEAFAGSGPDGFDTTGLVYYCFRQCEIAAPRDLDSQFQFGQAVPLDALQPGDVVFFYLENPGDAEYVGIYTGNDNFIAVSSSKESVVERYMGGDYYAERFIGARRYS